MLMLSALPRATAFTNVRRRFQPRVVLRGMGTEQLGAVAAPGVRVRAPWTNGQLYPGQVTSVEGDKVSIKFDDGDQREEPLNFPDEVTWEPERAETPGAGRSARGGGGGGQGGGQARARRERRVAAWRRV